MRFEIEVPENYDDVISVTAIGVKSGTTYIKTAVAESKGHSGETLMISENGDVRWKTPIMFNKTMEQIVKEEEQAKVDKAWENIKKLMGEEDFNEVKMIIKEAFKKACDK